MSGADIAAIMTASAALLGAATAAWLAVHRNARTDTATAERLRVLEEIAVEALERAKACEERERARGA